MSDKFELFNVSQDFWKKINEIQYFRSISKFQESEPNKITVSCGSKYLYLNVTVVKILFGKSMAFQYFLLSNTFQKEDLGEENSSLYRLLVFSLRM